MNAETKQKIIMALDVLGYEQEGNTLTFVHVAGNGERKMFRNWDAACDFAVDLAKKRLASSAE